MAGASARARTASIRRRVASPQAWSTRSWSTTTPRAAPSSAALSTQAITSQRSRATTFTPPRATDAGGLTNNALSTVAFGRVDNALVTAGGQVDVRGNFTVQLPAGTRQTRFTLRREQPNRPMRVDLVVTDQCGPWPTFVGAGNN